MIVFVYIKIYIEDIRSLTLNMDLIKKYTIFFLQNPVVGVQQYFLNYSNSFLCMFVAYCPTREYIAHTGTPLYG